MLAAEDLSDLIDLIHEATEEPAHWPRLLQRLGQAVLAAAPGRPQARPAVGAAGARMAHGSPEAPDIALTPPPPAAGEAWRQALGDWLTRNLQRHVDRALRQQQELNHALAGRDAVEQVFERLPLAMALVDAGGQVLSLNQALLALCRSGGALRLRGQRLVVDGTDATAWTEALGQAAAATPDRLLRLASAAGPQTVWLRRLPAAQGVRETQGMPQAREAPGTHDRRDVDAAHAADGAAGATAGDAAPRLLVLAAGSRSGRALAVPALQQLWQLSPAEARLTQQLALGRSVEDACTTLDIRPNTAKTHLKRIFAKVGVHRQSELVQAIYASPLWLEAADDPMAARNVNGADGGAGRVSAGMRPAPPAARADGPGGDHRRLRLRDGRQLSYSDSGDPAGQPLLLMHGMGGSRLLRPPDDMALLQRGLRLIIAERPGCGDSDPRPGRRIRDWPDDLAALMDHLRLGAVRLLGYSAGTPYALACALAWPQRVEALGLVAAVCPIDEIGDLQAYPPSAAAQLLLARYMPGLLPSLLGLALRGLREQPYRHVEQSLALTASATDRAVYQDPRLRAAHVHGLMTGVRGGTTALAEELALYAGAWDLDPAALRVPARLWHGDADPLVALAGARRLAARLPGARLQVLPGAGHLLLYSHWERILDELMADTARTSTAAPQDAAQD